MKGMMSVILGVGLLMGAPSVLGHDAGKDTTKKSKMRKHPHKHRRDMKTSDTSGGLK